VEKGVVETRGLESNLLRDSHCGPMDSELHTITFVHFDGKQGDFLHRRTTKDDGEPQEVVCWPSREVCLTPLVDKAEAVFWATNWRPW
jgi:hypothetical protein